MISFTLSLALMALGSNAPDVRGDSDCPSPDAVASRLRLLLPADGELPPGAWLEIARPATNMGTLGGFPNPPAMLRGEQSSPAPHAAAGSAAAGEIEVRMMVGTPPRALGVRRLASPGSCDEAAQAAAVVAATWTASYRSPPPLWFGDSSPSAIRKVDTESPIPFPRPDGAAAGGIRAVAPSATNAESFALDVGAAFGAAAATSGTAAPFLAAEVDLRRHASGARLLAIAFGARTIGLGMGQVAWRRLMAGAGVAHAWGTPAVQLQVGGDIVAGATFLEGSGFAQNAATTSFDAAAGPWARLAAPLAAAPVTVWVGAQGLAWAREQRIRVDGAVSTGSLPRLDLLVGAGLAWNPLGP